MVFCQLKMEKYNLNLIEIINHKALQRKSNRSAEIRKFLHKQDDIQYLPIFPQGSLVHESQVKNETLLMH